MPTRATAARITTAPTTCSLFFTSQRGARTVPSFLRAPCAFVHPGHPSKGMDRRRVYGFMAPATPPRAGPLGFDATG